MDIEEFIDPLKPEGDTSPFIYSRGILTSVHIADIHFGLPACTALEEYNILINQFINRIVNINFDILSIDGDFFHKKFPSSSDTIQYGLMFLEQCVNLCRLKNATLIIIAGTPSHDADQLSLFYHYQLDPSVDIRIIESAQFIHVKGAKILCIPEEHGRPASYYSHLLYHSGEYDEAYIHGTIKGSIYGADIPTLDSPKTPVFCLDHFTNCNGPIIAGHVHKAMCLEKYMYYTSNPIRFQHGEEEEKGFMILFHNLDNHSHYVHFEPIKSFLYSTIEINYLKHRDPNEIITYLNNLKANGVDYIRIVFSGIPPETELVVRDYYKNNKYFSFKDNVYDKRNREVINMTEDINDKYSNMGFLLDPAIDEYTKFVMFINYNKGEDFITVDKLKKVLAGKI